MNEGPRIGPQRVLMALILKYRDKGLKGIKAGGFIGHQRGKRGKLALREPLGNSVMGRKRANWAMKRLTGACDNPT